MTAGENTAPENAAALVCAVHDHDRPTCHRILSEASRDDLYAIAVILAASVREDDPLMAQYKPERLGYYQIRDKVCEVLELDPDHLTGRTRPCVRARQIIAWVCVSAGYSYSATGRLMGHDHTTIMHNVERVTTDRRLHDVAVFILGELENPKAEAA